VFTVVVLFRSVPCTSIDCSSLLCDCSLFVGLSVAVLSVLRRGAPFFGPFVLVVPGGPLVCRFRLFVGCPIRSRGAWLAVEFKGRLETCRVTP
jgi:hypothetical protein